MNLRIARARAATAGEWDRAWRGCDSATYFHGRAWAEVWSGYTGGRLQPAAQLLVFSDGAEVLVPLTRERLLGGWAQRALSSPAGTYGGWLATSTLSDEHARLLTAWMCRRHPDLVWRQNPHAPALPPDGLPWRSDHTHVLDLSAGMAALDSLWHRNGTDRKVRKALGAGVTVRRATHDDDWRDYHAIYLDSQQRWGGKTSSRYGLPLFDALRQRDAADGNVVLWLAMHDARVVAGALCLYAPRIAVYWHGAALQSHFEARPVNLLLHEAIRDAADRGLAWFDFNPSGGHAGVEAFKRSFGASQLECNVLKTERPMLRWLTRFAGTIRGRR